MSERVSADRKALVTELVRLGVDFTSVKPGPRGTLAVAVKMGSDTREKVPPVWEGRPVAVSFVDTSVAPRYGRSPAIPEVVHEVRQARYKGGGWVARWVCERGRGDVYGAELLTEVPAGASQCGECALARS